MVEIRELIIGAVMLISGIYMWVKIPEKSKKRFYEQSKKEEYIIATVVQSLGIYQRKEWRNQERNHEKTYYINKLLCSYWDVNGNAECEVEIKRPCGFNEAELSSGEKLWISKSKNGYIEYISDGTSTKEEIILNRVKGETFVLRFLLAFWILSGSYLILDILIKLL